MGKKYFALILSVFTCLFVKAQDDVIPPDSLQARLLRKGPVLTARDSVRLMGMPELKLPEQYRHYVLPPVVDNSTQPYFRPLFWQVAYECGQAAGIGYNFTYEMDRYRNVPANQMQNQYPTHFAWNFLNDGETYQGVSCFDGWEILKYCGTPNVQDYGGTLFYGGTKRWINGYDKYYNGMHNRIDEEFRIDVSKTDGLLALKNWIHDHLDGSAVGSLANFYAEYFGSVGTTLPPGTPEAGKYVQTAFGAGASHTWTIVGYNDSIRWDYNGDGQYTNDIDINGDGVVNMRDWEIGGLKFVNSFGSSGFCNGGFCYMTYKTLADAWNSGGIWNNSVYIIHVKEGVPMLTIKAKVKHTSREKLSIWAGMSTDLTATRPSIIYDFPIFNYHGGNYYMQGDTGEAAKTLEFGLDISPLLSNLSSGQPAKFFFQVCENDPANSFAGRITRFALEDYTNGLNEVICPDSNVNLVNNDTTTLSIPVVMNFSKPEITNDTLAKGILLEPYTYQLAASGGMPPYKFEKKILYDENVTTGLFPQITTQQLTPSANYNGHVAKTLPFPFPFYGNNYSQVVIYTNGTIMFAEQLYNWPYLINENSLFKNVQIIAPFMADLRINPSVSDGIWYSWTPNSCTFRWKASVNGQTNAYYVNLAVKLYSDGKMEFYYGNINIPASTSWFGAFSNGDGRNFLRTSLNNTFHSNSGCKIDTFTPSFFPAEMSVSEDGVFSGTPAQAYQNRPIHFMVTDASSISSVKVLNFSAPGVNKIVIAGFNTPTGNDSIVDYGDTVHMGVYLTNVDSVPVTNAVMAISHSDPNLTLLDSTQVLGSFQPGDTLYFPNAFTFAVSPSVPDNHSIDFSTRIIASQDTFHSHILTVAYAPVLQAGSITINDGGNGFYDPGETAEMIVTLQNTGGSRVTNIHAVLSSLDPFITINDASDTLASLNPYSSGTVSFNLTASPYTPMGYMVGCQVDASADKGYNATDSLFFTIGYVMEDFETGTFTFYPWSQGGTLPWTVDDSLPYAGAWCARSGDIADSQDSYFFILLNVLSAGNISFYKRVSCENDPNGTGYDYLGFYIDGAEQNRWDGEVAWSQETFPVSAGNHTLKWTYHKDYSVSSGKDAAWVDNIIFPPAQLNTTGFAVIGGVTYDNGFASPLYGATIYLKDVLNHPIDSVAADLAGHYHFDSIQNGFYKVTGASSTPWCGVDQADIQMIRDYLNGTITSFGDSLKLRAADVNNNGAVDAGDTVLIHNRLAGSVTSFPGGDWRFEEKGLFVNNNSLSKDLKGICAGDVNASGAVPVTLNTQPQNLTVCPGTNALFSVNASDADAYQWFESPDAGFSWTPLADDQTYSGTQSAVLSITSIPAYLQGYWYRCLLSNQSCSSVLSGEAVLTLLPQPPADAGPDQQLNAGATLVLTGLPDTLTITGCTSGCDIPSHCTSVATTYNEENVVNVTLNGASQSSPNVPAAGYTDYTDTLFTTLFADSSYTLSVTNWAQGAWTEHVSAFIDWNRDGDFEESGETIIVGSSTTLGNHTFSVTLTVPSGAVLGETRMRVINEYSTAPPACGTYQYGETEDYKIELKSEVYLPLTYLWTGPLNFTSNSRCASVSNVSCLNAGIYTFRATNPSGCTGTDQVSIQVSPAPDANAGNDVITCADSCVVLTGSGGLYYAWSNGSHSDTALVCPSVTTAYMLTVTDAIGCTDTDEVVVNVYPQVVVSLGNDTNLCYAQYIILDAGNPGASYQWSTGATTRQVVVDSAWGSGTYSVTVTDANGCGGTDAILIGFIPCAGLEETENQMDANIYPNPAMGRCRVTVTGTALPPAYEFTSAQGQCLQRGKISSRSEGRFIRDFDLKNLPKGIYLLKLFNPERVIIRKVTVQ